MRTVIPLAIAAAFLVFDWSAASGAEPVKKKAAPASTPAKKSTARSSARTQSASAGKSTKKGSASRSAPKSTWRNRQAAPSPERYKEIQEALAQKGYLSPQDANGVWNPGSADALKRFQADQNIEANGKINSLSLIALGLGPKHDSPSAVKPPAPASPQPDQSGSR
jgi:Putative peptidoglycan binding domain